MDPPAVPALKVPDHEEEREEAFIGCGGGADDGSLVGW